MTLEDIADLGRFLLREHRDPVYAHREFMKWDEQGADWLDSEFPDSGLSAEWSALPSSRLVIGSHYYGTVDAWNHFHNAVRLRLRFLAQVGASIRVEDVATQANAGAVITQVFIVHGRDKTALHEMTGFVRMLGLNPVVLHDQPNRGRTIIEKLEGHSTVGFAVVLLTPDDVGGTNAGELRPRARQNVILELGFFCALLTRARVCAVHKGAIEFPSDFDGVLYLSMDEHGAWRTSLAKEMRAAGLPIDMNRMIL